MKAKHVLSRARPGTCVQRAFISKVKAIEMRGQFTRGAPPPTVYFDFKGIHKIEAPVGSQIKSLLNTHI